MRLFAALLTAVAAALGMALVAGVLPTSFGFRRRERRESPLPGLLQQAGIELSPVRFRAAAVVAAAATFGMVLALTGVAAVAVVPGVIAGLTPRWWIARRAARRSHAVQQAWPDAIRDVLASIGAGMSLQRALEELAVSGPPTLREVFGRFSLTARAVGMGPALQAVREDLADATTDRVVEVLAVAHERGGSIVPEILRDLARATTRDLWLLEELHTDSLEQRINALAVFALPWLLLLAITIQDGPFRDFYRSGAGLVVIAVGGLASTVGMVMVRRLGAQPTEPRVMGS